MKIRDVFAHSAPNAVYVVAEIGINHNGDLKTALALIDAAAEAGVDAVKFQKRDLASIYVPSLLNDPNSQEWSMAYLLPQLKELELSSEDYQKIHERVHARNLEWIITPFDEHSADFVGAQDVAAIKIASADMVNFPLIQKCAGFGKPLLISTGMWSQEEIQTCVQWYNAHLPSKNYALLLANSTYPSAYENLGLPLISWLKSQVASQVAGYSGHERGIFIPIAAVAYGARIIEKHITFDSLQPGPDHKASLTPTQFKEMVAHLRDLEKSLVPRKIVNPSEMLAREVFAKSATAVRDLPVGTVLAASDFEYKSPGKGLFPHQVEAYIGKPIKRTVTKHRPISRHDFEPEKKIRDWVLPKFSRDWGVKCRFHDYEDYLQCKPKVIEFHMSEKDLDFKFTAINPDTQFIIHAPEFSGKRLLDICSSDPDVVQISVDVLQRTIDFTLELARHFPKSKPKIVAHLGGMSLSRLNNPYEEMMERSLENFRKLKFNSSDVEFLPECLPSNPAYFGGYWHQYGFMRSEDMAQFCDAFGLRMCFDTSHAALYCNEYGQSLADYTRRIKPYVSHVQIADAEGLFGEGVQIGEGSINFDEILTILEDAEFTWVPEPWSGHLHNGEGFYTSLTRLGKWSDKL